MKRRNNKHEELMLIPFLDILCSLIGVLVLIIVVLCIAQTQRAKGRTQEEMARSMQYVEARKKAEELQSKDQDVKDLLAKLEELRKESQTKVERMAKLRKLLDSNSDLSKMNAEFSERLMKELDNLLLEIDGLKASEKEVATEIASLNEELQKRQIPPDKKTPPVVVQPGGSGGGGANEKIYFVEVSDGKLVIFWDETQRTLVSTSQEVIATDESLQYFLRQVGEQANAKIIFLMRESGTRTYNFAAGWAQSTYNYAVDKIGRLPLPGEGEVDLKMFRDRLGKMTPPPEAKLLPVAPKA